MKWEDLEIGVPSLVVNHRGLEAEIIKVSPRMYLETEVGKVEYWGPYFASEIQWFEIGLIDTPTEEDAKECGKLVNKEYKGMKWEDLEVGVPYLMTAVNPYSAQDSVYEVIKLDDREGIWRAVNAQVAVYWTLTMGGYNTMSLDLEDEPTFHDKLFLGVASGEAVAKTSTPCTCPLYGEIGLLAIGCKCGGK